MPHPFQATNVETSYNDSTEMSKEHLYEGFALYAFSVKPYEPNLTENSIFYNNVSYCEIGNPHGKVGGNDFRPLRFIRYIKWLNTAQIPLYLPACRFLFHSGPNIYIAIVHVGY